MSGKKKNKGSFLRDVSFVLAVILLIAALGGIYFYNRMKNVQEEEKLEQIIANEKSPQISGAKVLSEQIAMTEEEPLEFEAESESAEPQTEDAKVAGKTEEKPESRPEEKEQEKPEEPKTEPAEELVLKEEEAAATPQTEAVKEEAKEATTEKPSDVSASNVEWQAAMPVNGAQGEALTLAEEPASQQTTEMVVEILADAAAQNGADVKNASILIINGTYKNGVATYWESRLKEAGYTNLLKASYSGKADQLTAIYGVDKQKAEAFKEFFPTAEIRDGAVPGGFTMADEGQQPPTTCDFYIVVGIADAVNS